MFLTDPLRLRPYWLERQIDPASPDFVPGAAAEPANLTHRRVTTIGILSHPERAAVDPRGLLTPDHAAWSIDWWIGAEDRWHLPSRARVVRQRLVGTAPVVETALRVPGGEVLHRAFGFLSTDLGPCIALEIENRSAVPVAAALAVRPYHPLGLADVRAIVHEGRTVHVDDRPALVLARPPAVARFGDSRTGDVLGSVQTGVDLNPRGALSAYDTSGRATAAFVSPLAHTAVLHALIPLAPPLRRTLTVPGELPFPDAVPTAEQVAKGWEAQARRAVDVNLPDARWQQALDAAVCHLLLAHGGEDLDTWPAGPPPELADVATILGALDQWGFDGEVAQVLATWPERQALDGAFASRARRADAAAAALDAVAGHWRLTGDTELVGELVGPLAKAVHWIGKRRGARRAARDPRAVAGAGGDGQPALLPDGGARPGGGPTGTYLRDTAVSVQALTGVAGALDAAGQPEVAADARALAAALSRDLDATIAAIAPDGAPIPPTPSRSVDGGVVVNLDLFPPYGSIPLDHPSAGATLDAVRALASGPSPAVPHLDGPAGLSPALTAQLAVLEIETGDARALDRLGWLVDVGGPTVAWPEAVHPRTGDGSWGAPHDPVVTAAFLTAVRRLLVREVAGGAGLALCSVVPPAWLGQPLDVRGASTAFGRFSFSVRWHGERPALLWELEPHARVETLTLTAPGLDPAWSATAFEGEALLAPVPPPAAPSAAEPSEPVAEDPVVPGDAGGGGSFT